MEQISDRVFSKDLTYPDPELHASAARLRDGPNASAHARATTAGVRVRAIVLPPTRRMSETPRGRQSGKQGGQANTLGGPFKAKVSARSREEEAGVAADRKVRSSARWNRLESRTIHLHIGRGWPFLREFSCDGRWGIWSPGLRMLD